MVDKSIISEKMSHINRCMERLQEKRVISKEEFLKDIDTQDIVLHNLQLSIQGCIDIASHIISDEGWSFPATMGGLFDILKEKNVISEKNADILKKMVNFRNIIIHEYDEIDLEKVYDIFKNRLSDITAYLKEIIKFLGL